MKVSALFGGGQGEKMSSDDKKIVIIGGGPAGLTAALELLRRGIRSVTVVEKDAQVGGISRTVVHNDNRMDIGGHRFFSKSQEVMDWWAEILPVEGEGTPPALPDELDRIILLRRRLSRIFYLRKFFSYPIALSMGTLRNLGLSRVAGIGLSYAKACLRPIKPEQTLEDFIVNRFGRRLYETFFRDYTHKVWGVPCNAIAADWGAQRIKGLSIVRVLTHAVKNMLGSSASIAQKDIETSLIERFWYPKLGPGSLWETVADMVRELGGTILMESRVTALNWKQDDGRVRIVGVDVLHADGRKQTLPCTSCISSMPLRELVEQLGDVVPPAVRQVAHGLVYRDFMTVGVLVRRLGRDGAHADLKDNWIYIQEPDVHVGRIQLFHNWSPWLVADQSKFWLGMEYFATEGDELWSMSDADFIEMAVNELGKLGFATAADVEDTVLLRVPKAYPAYFGSYDRIGEVQCFLNSVPNLYPVGRNGMHRYNNMDHSMLSAIRTVECILGDREDKAAIWDVNVEKEYHEGK